MNNLENELQAVWETLRDTADLALGGDSQSQAKSPDDLPGREMIDALLAGTQPSIVYGTQEAKVLIEQGGVGNSQEANEAFGTLVKRFNVLDLRAEIGRLAQGVTDPQRRGLIERMTLAAENIIRHAHAQVDTGTKRPDYEELYQGVALVAPPSPDTISTLEHLQKPRQDLMEALRMTGYRIEDEADLVKIVNQWKARKELELYEAQVRTYVADTIPRMIDLGRSTLLSRVDYGNTSYGPHLEGLPLGENLDIRGMPATLGYSAYSLWEGGLDPNGKSICKGIFAIKPEHHGRNTAAFHVTSHESGVGHYLIYAILDTLRRDKKIGFEGNAIVNNSPFHAAQEGYAQAVLKLIAGGDLNQVREFFGQEFGAEFGANLAVELALIKFQDCAKRDVFNLMKKGKSIDEIKILLREKYFLDEVIVNKMLGAWAKNELFAATVGAAYLEGSDTFDQLIAESSIDEIIRLALMEKGVIDIGTLREKLAKTGQVISVP
jgi:hypothetical protein